MVLRIVYAFTMRVNSDEPQHLHVLWGWSRGLRPYRDVFDNHPPLFHFLYAPIFGAFGERADILGWMRLSVLPLSGLSLWWVYRLGTTLYGKRMGIWAALATGFFPSFFFSSTQFRPDALWTALWLLLLAVILDDAPLTLTRMFTGGLLLGVVLAVSMKTFLMLCALGAGVAVILAARRIRDDGLDWARLGSRLLAAGVGAVIVPAAVAGYFQARGLWEPFVYGVWRHNFVPGGYGRWARLWTRGWVLPPLIALGGAAAVALGRERGPDDTRARWRRTFLVTVAVAYPVALCTVWPAITMQDWLPCIPLLVLVAAGSAARLRSRTAPGPGVPFFLFNPLSLCLTAGLGTLLVCSLQPPWRDEFASHRRLVADTLRLTRPGEFVMDAKGDTIYRPRAFYYALEGLTVKRIDRGLIRDDIVERLIATGTTLVCPAGLTERTRVFLRKNYVSLGDYCVLGQRLADEAKTDTSAAALPFDIVIPAMYRVIDAHGPVGGQMDGQASGAACWLAAGPHAFLPGPKKSHRKLVVLLARAVELGLSPFEQEKTRHRVTWRAASSHKAKP